MTTNPTITVEEVAPATAAQWLSLNHVNRKLRTRVVRKYADDMRAGRWYVDGTPVKFDTEGSLVDGQHRLTACVVVDLPFTTAVARGVAPDAQVVMDSGIGRSLHDHMAMQGESYATSVAALVRLDSSLARDPQLRTVTTNETNLALLERFEKDPDGYRRATHRGRHLADSVVGPASMWALAVLSIGRVPDAQEDADQFFDSVAEGASLLRDDPRFQLRRRLLSMERSYAVQRVGRREMYALTIKAWNLWRAGQKVQVLVFRGGGKKSEQVQEPR